MYLTYIPQVIGMSNQTQSKATAQCAIYSHFNDAVCYKLTSYRPQGRTFEFFLQIIISQPAQFSSLDLSNSAWCNSALWNQQVSILFSLVFSALHYNSAVLTGFQGAHIIQNPTKKWIMKLISDEMLNFSGPFEVFCNHY